jgi:hypothetical protein
MSATRRQTCVTFASSSGGQDYLFDVVVDALGSVSVKNIRGPYGAIDSATPLPDSVVQDMNEARGIVAQQAAESDVTSGTLTFTGQTYQDVAIAPGLLNNADYRVYFTTSDGMMFRAENLTTTGFRATAETAYGTVAAPKTVDWVVVTPTQATSTSGGTLTFVAADGGQKAVAFGVAFSTAAYRVLLSPEGFFDAKVVNKTKTGFTVQLGYTLQAAETVTVGYDVFV